MAPFGTLYTYAVGIQNALHINIALYPTINRTDIFSREMRDQQLFEQLQKQTNST